MTNDGLVTKGTDGRQENAIDEETDAMYKQGTGTKE